MARRCTLLALVSVFLFATLVVAAEQAVAPAPAMSEMRAGALQWAPLDIPGFVPGMKVAVLSGDPFKEGPYTIRLLFPAGYAFPAHWHPNVENLTVVSGTFQLGMGEKTDAAKLKNYAAGDYLFIPPQMPHFGGAAGGESIIQLHGPGPFGVTVIEAMKGAVPIPPPAPKQ
jgi:quercetin dioxygenase-like cupin family protein